MSDDLGQEIQKPDQIASVLASARTIAHISDLHLGKSLGQLKIVNKIHTALLSAMVDLTIVTGDVTQHGLRDEYRCFEETFKDLIDQGKLVVVPGNHDRWNDDAGKNLMNGERIAISRHDGVLLVRIDSTETRNHIKISGHGKITEEMILTVEKAILEEAHDDLVVVAMHHHPLPQPEDLWIEKLSNWLRLPFAKELRAGQELIRRLNGKCDLVLHGHRHTLKETLFNGERAMGIYNAGSTPNLGCFRVFEHQDGRLVRDPAWISVK